jgi:hypothetical protein
MSPQSGRNGGKIFTNGNVVIYDFHIGYALAILREYCGCTAVEDFDANF